MEKKQKELGPELMLVPEAAEFLRLRPSTLRSWVLHKKVPYCKLGGRVCIRRADLEQLINNSVVPPVPRDTEGSAADE